MKKKQIEKVPLKLPKQPKEKGKNSKEESKQWITVQIAESYILFDIWKKSTCIKRHAMHIETGEYATYEFETGEWCGDNLMNAIESNSWYWGITESNLLILQEDTKLVMDTITDRDWGTWLDQIEYKERAYSTEMREQKIYRKEQRLRELMSLCSTPGTAVKEWLVKVAVQDLQYAFYDKAADLYHCTACEKDFQTDKKTKIRHKDKIQCPLCQHEVVVWKRGESVTVNKALTIIQNMDEKRGVERHFYVEINWQKKRTVHLEEAIRLFMLRDAKNVQKIYYKDHWGDWSEGNRHNRRWKTSYLYPDTDEIQAGLKDTHYEPWLNVLPQLAAAGLELNYNQLLVESNHYFVNTTEYLFKGRFYRLLQEEVDCISYWFGYRGGLYINGPDIETVMGIKDRQLINRLRQENGGTNMLDWLQWSDSYGKKLSTEFLRWAEKEGISAYDYEHSRIHQYMNPEQMMNYLNRQKKECYPKWKVHSVLNQYEDYMSMASQLGKRVQDALVNRPRELKYRHDELVKECEARAEELRRKRDKEAAKKAAADMRRKYPGSEEILAEITPKFAWEDENYIIVVPKNFTEITAEGMALHHCVGHTERYFDRIVSRETYIVFLRKKSDPKVPFYTIEVEPGGTIRQHRGMYDEEPDIELVKPSLRAWQKHIRNGMSKKDHELAEQSKILREKNLEELREKNNTLVLNGLMEDLMEVI